MTIKNMPRCYSVQTRRLKKLTLWLRQAHGLQVIFPRIRANNAIDPGHLCVRGSGQCGKKREHIECEVVCMYGQSQFILSVDSCA